MGGVEGVDGGLGLVEGGLGRVGGGVGLLVGGEGLPEGGLGVGKGQASSVTAPLIRPSGETRTVVCTSVYTTPASIKLATSPIVRTSFPVATSKFAKQL